MNHMVINKKTKDTIGAIIIIVVFYFAWILFRNWNWGKPVDCMGNQDCIEYNYKDTGYAY